MSESKNLRSLICMCIITVLYLGSIGLCRTVIFSTILKIDDKVINYVSLGIFSLIFLIGPFSLPFLQKILTKFTYKAVFFFTSVANIISMFLYVLIIEKRPQDDYIIAVVLLLEAIAAPFMSIFYCTFNYYVLNISKKNTTGTYFGIAYSFFCMQNFFGDIFIQFGEEMFKFNNYFYYPMLGASLMISFCYWFIQEPSKISKTVTESIDLDEKLNKHLYGSEDYSQDISQEDLSYKNQFKKIWHVLSMYEEFRYLILTIFSIGLYTSFSVVYSQDMIEPNFNNFNLSQIQKELSINMGIHGIGSFLGGITSGLFSDIYGYLNLLLFIQIFAIVTFTLSDCWRNNRDKE